MAHSGPLRSARNIAQCFSTLCEMSTSTSCSMVSISVIDYAVDESRNSEAPALDAISLTD